MKLQDICQIHYLSFPLFFFFTQISSDLPNNTKDKINKCNNISKFFSSLSFPPFHHHIYHNNLNTFPLKRDKNKNTKYCYSDNTAGFLRESGSTESAPTLHHPNNHKSKLQEVFGSLESFNLQSKRCPEGLCSPWSQEHS